MAGSPTWDRHPRRRFRPNRRQAQQIADAAAWKGRKRTRSKSVVDRLDSPIHVLLTKDERAACRGEAARAELSLSAWVRKIILAHLESACAQVKTTEDTDADG